jgi:hypothetical protein
MATATVTFSSFRGNNIHELHAGMNVAGGALSRSVTLSPSGRLKMFQLPHGATIVDYWVRIQCAADDDQQSFQMGTSQTRSGILALRTLTSTYTFSASISLDTLTLNLADTPTAIRAPSGTRGLATGVNDLLPVRISLSDDAQPQNVWVIGTLGAGISASAYITALMFYVCDGLAGHTTIR